MLESLLVNLICALVPVLSLIIIYAVDEKKNLQCLEVGVKAMDGKYAVITVMIKFYFPVLESRNGFQGIHEQSIFNVVHSQAETFSLSDINAKKIYFALLIKATLVKFVDCVSYQIAYVKILKVKEDK